MKLLQQGVALTFSCQRSRRVRSGLVNNWSIHHFWGYNV